MARRKSSKAHLSDALPIWTTDHSQTVHMAYESLMHGIGVTDLASYWREMRVSIGIGVVVCALYGATAHGITGLLLGALLGLALPALLLWFVVLLLAIAIYLAVYFLAWTTILAVGWWLLTAVIGG